MPVTDDADRLARSLRAAFTPGRDKRLGVAVSGGGDSVALMVLLGDWRRDGGPELAAVTVDHGLRAESAAEAAGVAALCGRLGVPHAVLRWAWDGKGNLADAARRGRYRLIGDWAGAQGIGAVALGHTADDQAETVLMRLARGSGVDGLSGMAVRRRSEGVEWVRPLLELRRGDLRRFLTGRGLGWVDDPTNEDAAYDRVKARRALEVLGPLGVDTDGLVDTAQRMGMARDVLDDAALTLARRAVRIEAGDVAIGRAMFLRARPETQYRVLAHAVRWIAGASYRPRMTALTEAHAAAVRRSQSTLAGCIVSGDASELRIAREPNAVSDLSGPTDAIWDGRWVLTGPHAPGLTIRALGEAGLRDCPDWRATGLPRPTLLASPSVWRGDALISAPFAGQSAGWTATLRADRPDFFASLVTH